MTTTSQSAAAALSPYDSSGSMSGQRCTMPSRASIARYFDREPITDSYPIDARRAASALPAGPVPPRIPIRIGTWWHTGLGPPQGNDRVTTGAALGWRPMGLLEGKNIVVTGVLTDASIAFGVAALAQQEGANILLTGAGRALSLTC